MYRQVDGGWGSIRNEECQGRSETSLTNATPGHTESHNTYLVNGTHLLTGDSLLIRGCGRTDFQSGNAGVMYDATTQRLFTLPDAT